MSAPLSTPLSAPSAQPSEQASEPLFTASAAPRVASCPPSVALPQVSTLRDGMTLGRLVHGFMEALNKGSTKDEAISALPADSDGDDARALCTTVDPAQVPLGVPEIAYAYDVRSGRAWRLPATGSHRGYGPLGSSVIPGTIDLLVEGIEETGNSADARWRVIDWSTDHDLDVPAKRQQVETYMLMVARAHGLSEVHGAIGSFRLSGVISWHEWSLDEWGLNDVATRLLSAWNRAQEAVQARADHEFVNSAPWSPDVVSGPHCRDCKAFMACPATRAAVAVTANGLPAPDVSGDAIGAAYEQATRAEKWAKEVRERARVAVTQLGQIALPNNKRLIEKTDKNGRKSLKTVNA